VFGEEVGSADWNRLELRSFACCKCSRLKRKIIKSSKSFFVASGPIAEWVAMLLRVCVERVRLPYVRLCRDFVGNRQKAFKASETEKSANRVLKNASFDWLFVYPFSL